MATVESSAATSYNGGGVTSDFDLNLPAGIVAGDLLIAFSVSEGASYRWLAAPVGWSLIDEVTGSLNGQIFTRVADGGEGATQQFSTVTGDKYTTGNAVVLRISDADSDISVVIDLISGTGTQQSSPAIVTGSDGLIVTGLGDNRTNQGFTAPAGHTLVNESDGNSSSLAVASTDLNAGSHGPFDWTVSVTWHSTYVAFSVGVADAAGGGGATGTATQTLPFLNQAAAGQTTAIATAVQTLPFLSQQAFAAATTTGQSSQTLPFLTQIVVGQATTIGQATSTLPFLTQSASGDSGGEGTTGAASQVLPFLQQSAVGSSTATGTASQLLPFLSQALVGQSTTTGSIGSVLPFIVQAAYELAPVVQFHSAISVRKTKRTLEVAKISRTVKVKKIKRTLTI